MAGPWEKYQAAAPQGAPWQQFGGPQAADQREPAFQLGGAAPEELLRGTPEAVMAAPAGFASTATGGAPAPTPTGLDRAAQLTAQQTGRAAATVAGAPVDLTTLLANLAAGAGNWAVDAGQYVAGDPKAFEGPGPIPYITDPVGGRDDLLREGTAVMAELGVPMIPRGQQTDTEQFIGDVGEGAQSMLMPGFLLSKLGQRAAATNTINRLDSTKRAQAFLPQPVGAGWAKPYTAAEELAQESPTAVGRAFQLAKPQVRDAAMGGGAVAAMEAGEDIDMVDDAVWDDIIRDLVLGTGGAIGAHGVTGIALAPRAAGRALRDAFTKSDLKPDEKGAVPNRRLAGIAADEMKNNVVGKPGEAAADLREARDVYRENGAKQTPTTGLLGKDEGLIALDKTVRQEQPVLSAQRDNLVRGDMQGRVENLKPAGDGDFEDTETMVRRLIEERMAPPRAEAKTARMDAELTRRTNADKLDGVEAWRDNDLTELDDGVKAKTLELEGDPAEGFPGARGEEREIGAALNANRGNSEAASRRLDKAVVDDTMKPLEDEQRKLYAAIDPEGKVVLDAGVLTAAVQSVRTSAPRLAPKSKGAPEDWLSRLEEVAEGGPVTFKELNAMRPLLADDIRGAETKGDFALVRGLKQIKSVIDDTAEALAQSGDPAGMRALAAKDFTKNRFAPLFKQGAGGKLRDDIQGDDLARSRTHPTQTAKRFMTDPESAADLQRILNESPSRAAGETAARDYVLAALADSGVVDSDNLIRPDTLVSWISRRKETFAQVPSVRDELMRLQNDVRARNGRSAGLVSEIDALVEQRRYTVKQFDEAVQEIKADTRKTEAQKKEAVEAAEMRLAETTREVNRSALRGFFDEIDGRAVDPQVAVERVFSSTSPSKAMAEIVEKVKSNPNAAAGWKREVVDYVQRRISNSAETPDGAAFTSDAKLNSFLREHDKALAELFEPNEMKALRFVRREAADMAKRAQQATVGSPTSENMAELMRHLEIGAKAIWGVLKGGGITRTIRLALPYAPGAGNVEKAHEIVKRAMLDPDLAIQLLEMPVSQQHIAKWQKRTAMLLSAAHAGPDEDEAE